MKALEYLAIVLVLFLFLIDEKEEINGLNLFLSPQQAQAFVADVKSTPPADPSATAAEEIGVPVRPGEVEKEIQEEFIEDNSDPQEAALESEERTREKTEL